VDVELTLELDEIVREVRLGADIIDIPSAESVELVLTLDVGEDDR
jgi:hypothetical protein